MSSPPWPNTLSPPRLNRSSPPLSKMVRASRLQVVDAVESCLSSGEYSDLTIQCGDDVYKVHKVVVCTRAGFFARAIKFGGKEAQENVINLPKDGPATIASLVKYLYSGTYSEDLLENLDPETELHDASNIVIRRTPVSCSEYGCDYKYDFPHTCSDGECNDMCLCAHHFCIINCDSTCQAFVCNECCSLRVPGSPSQLLSHSKMYEIADKYEVTGLKELACKNFVLACEAFWDDEAFPITIKHAFSTTVAEDRGLRDVIIKTVFSHDSLVRKAKIQAVMLEHSDLAVGVLLKKV